MGKQNFDQIFGEPGRGDYRAGDKITFTENGKPYTGEVIHCSAPAETVKGRRLPLTYEVDCNDGFPHIVTSGQIVER